MTIRGGMLLVGLAAVACTDWRLLMVAALAAPWLALLAYAAPYLIPGDFAEAE